MDIQFYGANCIAISTKHVRLVFDDNLESLGAKSVVREGDIAFFTQIHDPVTSAKLTVDIPGEYEAQGVSVTGYQSRGHTDGDKERNSVMYKITAGDIKVLVTGHIYPQMSEAKLDDIGLVDIMIVPVGGHGYTLDPTGALQVIKKIEPSLVIPTHYADSSLKYEMPQTSLSDALKEMSMEPSSTVRKLQVKTSDFEGGTKLIVLEKV